MAFCAVLDGCSFVTYRPSTMSNTISSLSIAQLKHAISIREQIDSLHTELSKIMGGQIPVPFKRKGMSAAGRRAVAAAQKARWAKLKAGKVEKPSKGRKKMSAAWRAKIAAAAKLRWKKAKAAGKTRL
jgi:hypothetical protein